MNELVLLPHDIDGCLKRIKNAAPMIKTHTEKNKDARFMYITLDMMSEAMTTVNGNGYKLYTYYYAHFNSESFDNNIEAIMKQTGMSSFEFVDAFEQLLGNGYLHQDEKNPAMYHFFPRPVHGSEDARRYIELCNMQWARY